MNTTETTSQNNTGKVDQGHRVHTKLHNIICNNPGITRKQIIAHEFLQQECLTLAQRVRISSGDEKALKQWNRKISRYLRQIKRDGHDLIVSKHHKHAFHYIGKEHVVDASPDTSAAPPQVKKTTAFNKAIQDFWQADEELEGATQVPFQKVDPKRALEQPDQVISFDQLMADMDSDVLGQTDAMKEKNLLF